MRGRLCVALTLALALTGCATAPAARWSRLEGCWEDTSGAIPPAFVQWSKDGAGGWRGAWRVETGNPDTSDALDFTLTPDGSAMHLCEQPQGVAESCARALFTPHGAHDGDWVFFVQGDRLGFSVYGREGMFFYGRSCEAGPHPPVRPHGPPVYP